MPARPVPAPRASLLTAANRGSGQAELTRLQRVQVTTCQRNLVSERRMIRRLIVPPNREAALAIQRLRRVDRPERLVRLRQQLVRRIGRLELRVAAGVRAAKGCGAGRVGPREPERQVVVEPSRRRGERTLDDAGCDAGGAIGSASSSPSGWPSGVRAVGVGVGARTRGAAARPPRRCRRGRNSTKMLSVALIAVQTRHSTCLSRQAPRGAPASPEHWPGNAPAVTLGVSQLFDDRRIQARDDLARSCPSNRRRSSRASPRSVRNPRGPLLRRRRP